MSWKNLINRLLGKKPKAENIQMASNRSGVTSLDRENQKNGDEKRPESKQDRGRKVGQQQIKIPAGSTQISGAHEKLPWLQLLIGLDFGTAFTKIVIAESRTRYAVPVGLLNGGEGFCLPCALYVGAEGQVALQASDVCPLKKANLKMPLIEGNYSHDDLVLVVAYLALVLRLTRTWFITEHAKTYQGKYLDWNVNVGLPTEKFHDEKMVGLYGDLVSAAWFLSTGDEEITLDAAGDGYNDVSKRTEKYPSDSLFAERLIHRDKVNCFPEFVALVSGYVRSPRRQNDLHVMVDIGAGTADVTVFNVHQDNDMEDVFPIFAKGVQPLGVTYLLRNRLRGLGRKEEVDPTQPVLNAQSFAEKFNIAENLIPQVDANFCKDFHVLVASELKRVKLKRYRNSPRWKTGVPCFLSGGGKDLEPYQDVLKAMMDSSFPFRIKLDELPFPNDLNGPSLVDDDFHRLLVAYGLSVDPFDVGKIIKSQDVPDDDEPDIDNNFYEDRYICKEMT